MPEGADISEHQGDLEPGWFDQFEFVIIRAFNENGNPDWKFRQNWERAKGRTLRGAYGWPIRGAENVGLGERLVAVSPDAEFGHWADVEHSGRGIPNLSEIEYYLIGIGDRLRGFYSNIGELPRSAMLDKELWWMADYGPNDGRRHDPNEQPPKPPRAYQIHQYTSAGGLDRNWAESLPAPSPAPKEDDMPLRVRHTSSAVFACWDFKRQEAKPESDYWEGRGVPIQGPSAEWDAVLAAIPTWSASAGGQALTGTITGKLTVP